MDPDPKETGESANDANTTEDAPPSTTQQKMPYHSHPYQPPTPPGPGQSDSPSADGNASVRASTSASADADADADLPAAFPTRRRGRPPGRPNMNVRDADYADNPEVQTWNGAKQDTVFTVQAVSIREALTEASLIHEIQRKAFQKDCRQVIFFMSGWITAKHIASKRPSYVNGLLIHSRGNDATHECTRCTEKRGKNSLGPFLSCRTLPGYFGDSCSNCKWFDNTSQCSLYSGPKPNRKRKTRAPSDEPGEPAEGPEPMSGLERSGHPVDPNLIGPGNALQAVEGPITQQMQGAGPNQGGENPDEESE